MNNLSYRIRNYMVVAVLVIVLPILGTSCKLKKKADNTSSSSPSTVASEQPLNSGGNGEVEKGFKLYENSQYSLSFQYPDDWTVNEGYMSTVVAVKAPIKAGDVFQENFNVVAQNSGTYTNKDLDTIIKTSSDSIKKIFPSMSTVNTEDAKLSGNDAKKIVYTTTQYGIELKQAQIYTIKNGKLYVTTFRSLKILNHDFP